MISTSFEYSRATSLDDALAIREPDRDTIDDLGKRIVAELSRRHPETEFSAVTQEQILGVLGDILGILTGASRIYDQMLAGTDWKTVSPP